MKFLIVLLATLAVASCGNFAFEPGYRVRFSEFKEDIGVRTYLEIPRALQDALALGWTKVARPEGSPLPSLELYCLPDRAVGLLFDDTGYIAGMQIALDKSKVSDTVLDWEIQGWTTWQPDDDGRTYWTTQQFYVDEEFLAQDPSQRVAARNANKILQMDGIWVTGIDKQLMKIPGTKEGIENTLFTKQACIPGMGRHYYYNMSATTECNSRSLFPWFSLVYGGELIGSGFLTYGKMNLGENDKNWFEKTNRTVAQLLVPHGSECVYDWADIPGRVSMHIYYIDHPWVDVDCVSDESDGI